MANRLQLEGLVFGRLTVLEAAGLDSGGNSLWRCRCKCGTTITTCGSKMRNGKIRSCGCLARELSSIRNSTHGHKRGGKRSPTYYSWLAMRERCYYKKHPRYHDYGGRGIKVCTRWRWSFQNFLYDMGVRPNDKTIDRKDNDGNYTPENCQWSTPKNQARNRRSTKQV